MYNKYYYLDINAEYNEWTADIEISYKLEQFTFRKEGDTRYINSHLTNLQNKQ